MNLIKKGRMIKNLSFCLFCKLEKKAERKHYLQVYIIFQIQINFLGVKKQVLELVWQHLQQVQVQQP